jgi:hypothetical protein
MSDDEEEWSDYRGILRDVDIVADDRHQHARFTVDIRLDTIEDGTHLNPSGSKQVRIELV